MNHRALWLAVLATLVNGRLQAQAHPKGFAADSAALAKTVLDYVAAAKRGDIDAALASFADDATFITTSGRYIAGLGALRGFYESLFTTPDSVRYEHGKPVVRMIDDRNALIYYTWKVDWYRSSGPTMLDDVGLMTVSARKRGSTWYWLAVTAQRMPEFLETIVPPRSGANESS